MKRLRHLWILVLFFGLVSMSACGKPDEKPEDRLEERPVIVDIIDAMAANKILKQRNEELEGILKRSQEKQTEYANAIRIIEDANLELRVELALVKSLGVGRTEDYERVLNELVALKAEKKDWGIFAAKGYEQLLKNYNQLAALYPPKNFPDKETLVEWRADSGNVTELGDLGLQNLAFEEGYLVSVCPTLDYCVAVVGEWWYKITPGDKDFVEKLKKVKQ